ncbi:MAG: DNA-binding protein [Deltaproteobacteria bacterium]|jgi:predicted RNase H-like nuclease (RuvC/YqgF family)|nr:DNA-binding protein [Deltaproteobacteria bacterium]
MYSLKEAAAAVGVGKPALLKAIQKGRISASKNDFGQWEIDPAELHRVYKPIPQEPLPDLPGERRETQETIPELRAKLEAMTEIKARLENECADLRRRLDAESEERRRTQAQLTGLLTDGKGKNRGFFRKWFRW